MNQDIDNDLEFVETQIVKIKKRLRDRSWPMRIFRVLVLFLLIVTGLAVCVSLYGKHYLDTHPDVQQKLVQTVSDSFGIPINVAELGVGWEWKGPKLVAQKLSFYPDSEQSEAIVVFDEVSVVLDLPGYFRNWVLNVADVTLSGAEIQLAQRDAVWYLNDYPISSLENLEEQMKVSEIQKSDVEVNSDFKLPLGKFSVKDINFVYLNEAKEELWRFDSMNAFVENDENTRIKFQAEDNPLYDKLEFTANSRNVEELLERDWQLLLDAEGVNAEQFIQDWKKLIRRLIVDSSSVASDPEQKIRLVNGKVDAKIWSQVKTGDLLALNGQVGFTNLHFEQGLTQPVRIKTIPELSFNVDINKQYRLFSQLPENQDLEIYEELAQSQKLSEEVSTDENNNKQTELLSSDSSNGDLLEKSKDQEKPAGQIEQLVQEETLLRLSNWAVKSDLGLWPKSDINFKKISYRDDLNNFELDELPEVKQIKRKSVDEEKSDFEHSGLSKNTLTYELTADYIYLGDLAPMLAVVSSGTINSESSWQFIDWRKLDGKIHDIHLKFNDTLNDDDLNKVSQLTNINETSKKNYIEFMKVRFEDLSVPQVNNQLHLRGLNGQIDLHNDKGTINLSSSNFIYEHLDLFRNEIELDTLQLTADVDRHSDLWSFKARDFILANEDIEITGQAEVDMTQDGFEVVSELQTDIKNIETMSRYYPVKIMKEGLVNWLERGFVSGEIGKANISLKGDLTKFPFRDGGGEFKAEFPVKDLVIDYASSWPAITLESGNVSFINEGVTIDVEKSKSKELDNLPFQAVFSDMSNTPLVLSIERQPMELQKTVTWLKQTPIYAELSSYFDSLDFRGSSLVDLEVTIPPNNTDDTSLNGRLSLNNNPLKIAALDDLIENVTGDIYFTEKSVSAEGLTALVRNQAITADVIQANEATVINLSGEAELATFLQSEYLTGRSRFTASVNVPKTDDAELGIDVIEVSSNLLGAQINLPAPFAKDKDAILPLTVRINMAGTQNEAFTLIGFSGSLGKTLLQGRLFKDSNNADPEKEMQLHSLALIGDGRAEYLQQVDLSKPQIQVLGQFSRLDADEWFTFINELEDDENSQIELGLVDIALDEMNLLGQSISNAEVRVLPTDDTWQIRLLNADMNGNVRVPRPWSDTLPIEIDMDRIYFKDTDTDDNDPEELENEENALSDVDLTKIPNMNFNVSDFRYNTMDLGLFSGRVVQDGKGASLKDAKITNPAFDIEASGGWFNTDQGEQTLFSMQMQSRNFTQSLQRLGFAPLASASVATADIELDWQGNPLDDLLDSVSGKITFNLRNGNLQEVDPGAGRFLALLSIAQLPSRLSLDFRDVFGKGLKYDELSGDFLLSNGQAYTNNMLMRGPVADVGMIGRVGLATRDFEQAAVVRADFGSTLPLAGALAGGLGVGAAVLLFSEIFKKPIKDATQIFYQIEGDWGKPDINRIKPSQLKEIPIAP